MPTALLAFALVVLAGPAVLPPGRGKAKPQQVLRLGMVTGPSLADAPAFTALKGDRRHSPASRQFVGGTAHLSAVLQPTPERPAGCCASGGEALDEVGIRMVVDQILNLLIELVDRVIEFVDGPHPMLDFHRVRAIQVVRYGQRRLALDL